MLKRKSIGCNRIASVSYVEKKIEKDSSYNKHMHSTSIKVVQN